MPKSKRPEKRLLNKRESRVEEMGVPVMEQGALSNVDKGLIRLMKQQKIMELAGEEKGALK